MTAEVAILNKTAVALAADSAITIASQKVYNSGNKLFTLSKYCPIGIMVFGNAEFMDMPWETILKTYRRYLFNKKFKSLKEYADDFLDFIRKDVFNLWGLDIQESYFKKIITVIFSTIHKEINEEVQRELKIKNLIIDDVEEICKKIIDIHYQKLVNAQDLFENCDVHQQNILSTYKNILSEAKNAIFQKLPIEMYSSRLDLICALFFCKRIFSDLFSGVVIAGFGEEDVFPSLIEYQFKAVLGGDLIYNQEKYHKVSRDQSAIIVPFAQREMVNTFVEGIDPSFRDAINSYFKSLLQDYPINILSTIPELSEERRNEIIHDINNVAIAAYDDIMQRINKFSSASYIEPVLQAVNALPKDELASMAESLVNMTSFKRRVSMQKETVGGPIDVAVISKGDGFIWIKRKHYFKPEFNPTFFSNYFRDEIKKQER